MWNLLFVLIILAFIIIACFFKNKVSVKIERKKRNILKPIKVINSNEEKRHQMPPELKELYRVLYNVENYKGTSDGMLKEVKKE